MPVFVLILSLIWAYFALIGAGIILALVALVTVVVVGLLLFSPEAQTIALVAVALIISVYLLAKLARPPRRKRRTITDL